MKKLFAIILAIMMVFALTACGKKKREPFVPVTSKTIGASSESASDAVSSEPVNKSVRLTGYNIDDYLHFEDSGGSVTTAYVLGYPIKESTYSIKIYPIAAGSFENVKITYKVDLGYFWYLNGGDIAIDNITDEEAHKFTYTVTLPVDGEKEITHKINSIGLTDFDDILWYVSDVTGTFKPN